MTEFDLNKSNKAFDKAAKLLKESFPTVMILVMDPDNTFWRTDGQGTALDQATILATRCEEDPGLANLIRIMYEHMHEISIKEISPRNIM